MVQNTLGFEIPGAIASSLFARKPATHIQSALKSGQPLLIFKKNRVLAAIVPITERSDFVRYLRTCPSEQTESAI